MNPDYLLTYENQRIKYYAVYKLETSHEYIVGRETPDSIPDIIFRSPTISRKQGIVTYLYGTVHYKDLEKINPSILNNRRIPGKSYPIRNGDILAYTCDNHRFAFMFLTKKQDWKCCRLTGKDVIIGNPAYGDDAIAIPDISGVLFELKYIDGRYFVAVTKEASSELVNIDDNGDDEEIVENYSLDWERIYRFAYKNYLFVIGGNVLLYGTI